MQGYYKYINLVFSYVVEINKYFLIDVRLLLKIKIVEF